MYRCVPVPGLYRGGPAQGDRGGEGGHQETQVLPADQEGGGEQNTQGERRLWHLTDVFWTTPMRKNAPNAIWRMFSELPHAQKCTTCHLSDVFWSTLRKIRQLTSDGCFLNFLCTTWHLTDVFWTAMRKMRRLTSGGCFLNYLTCAKMHNLTSDRCFLNYTCAKCIAWPLAIFSVVEETFTSFFKDKRS